MPLSSKRGRHGRPASPLLARARALEGSPAYTPEQKGSMRRSNTSVPCGEQNRKQCRGTGESWLTLCVDTRKSRVAL